MYLVSIWGIDKDLPMKYALGTLWAGIIRCRLIVQTACEEVMILKY